MAFAGGMIDEDTFSVCIWSLLYATIFAPFTFRYVLKKYVQEMGLGSAAPKAEAAKEASKDAAAQEEAVVEVEVAAPEADIVCSDKGISSVKL